MGAEYRIGAGNWAMLYLAIGDEVQALDWLQTAADSPTTDAGYISLAYIASNIFSDPAAQHTNSLLEAHLKVLQEAKSDRDAEKAREQEHQANLAARDAERRCKGASSTP